MVDLDFRVIIADDNDGMRLLLRKAIERVSGFGIVGEAKDGETALRLIESLKPQVVFLDVEMPVLDGIECAKRIIDFNPKIKIIFATGHEEYMPEAFEVYAFDYLVKPFKMERISQTLERIKNLHLMQEEHSIVDISNQKKVLKKIIIRNKEGVSFIDMDDIIMIQREDRSTAVYTENDRYITSEGLTELEEKLDRTIFFRSHKSYIINLTMISKIFPYGRWTYIIKLKNTVKDALITSDKYEELQKLFK